MSTTSRNPPSRPGVPPRQHNLQTAVDAAVEAADGPGIAALQTQIEEVDHEVMRVSVPLGYADQLYNLRSHIALVRDRIAVRRRKIDGN